MTDNNPFLDYSAILSSLMESGVRPEDIIQYASSQLEEDTRELSEYEEIIRDEDFFRNYLYNPSYSAHQMNEDPYYDLIRLTDEHLEAIEVFQRSDDHNLLFGKYDLTVHVSSVEIAIKALKRICVDMEGMIVAGGILFTALFGEIDILTQDIDYFLLV